METKQIITLGTDGKYYNQFGSLCFPNMMKAAHDRWEKVRFARKTKCPKIEYKSKHLFKEFEIHAIAYYNLVNYFKGYNRVKGEFLLHKSNDSCYYMCDIAILDKDYKNPLVIVEVKRNYYQVGYSKKQIDNYFNFCDKVVVISSMEEAENIVSTIKELNIK